MFECEAKGGSCELELDFEFCVSKAILTFFSIMYLQRPFLHHREHSPSLLEIPTCYTVLQQKKKKKKKIKNKNSQ